MEPRTVPERRVLGVRVRYIVWIALPLGGLVLVVSVLAAYRLTTVAHDLRDARALIDRAGSDVEQGDLAGARTALDQAQARLIALNNKLYTSADIELIGSLPVISDNLGSLRDSVGVALQLVNGGDELLRIAQPLEDARGKLEVSLNGGTIPLATIEDAQKQADALVAALPPAAEEPPGGRFLLGDVSDLQHRVYAEAGRRREQLDNVARALRLLSDMAGGNGDRRYLIAVANPAEMRGAGGMVLSYGVLQSAHGTFQLGDFGPIDDLFVDQAVDPAALHLPQDYVTRWSSFEPTRLWRNATVGPDFTVDAPILEALYTKRTGLRVDGVVQIDPEGLAAILTGTGPVQVAGVGTVSADNVVDLTLNRAYIDFPNRDQRQELLGDVAETAFRTLVNGRYSSLRPFGTALLHAAGGRHLLLDANQAGVESEARFFGADGSLPDPARQDYALLTVQNLSGNKLDYYVDTALTLTGDRPTNAAGRLTATVTIANNAPAGGVSSYVFGPNAPTEQAGLYRGLVSLYLPHGVALTGVSGDPTTTPPVVTAESGRSVATFGVELAPGEQRAVVLEFTIAPRPHGSYSIQLVPTPRVRPTVVSVDIAADGRRAVLAPTPLAGSATVATR